ncbi:MAG TPA: hypothetical protein VMC09_11560 [Anaerolineales bacterium]|nr:hypothetical protein [Anaerolineales bacterium]
MAHELTHVMQQGGDGRMIQRQETSQSGAAQGPTALLNLGDPLSAYTVLHRAISADQWAGLNQAATNRMNRQYARRGMPAESSAASTVAPLTEITIPAQTLLRPEEPTSDENVSSRLFTALTTGGDVTAAGGITRDHIAYMWYHSSPSALRSNVRVALIDPQGETELPPGLTFQVDNHPIASEDGGLYLAPVDHATSQYLPAITEQVNNEVQRVVRAAELSGKARAVIDFGRTITGRSPSAIASDDFTQFIAVLNDMKQRIQTYNESNPETAGLLGGISTELTAFIDGSARPFATRIEAERQAHMPSQSVGETMLGEASQQMANQRQLMEQARHEGFFRSLLTYFAAGQAGRTAGITSGSYMTVNLLTGNQLEVSRELHQAFRGGRISLDDFQTGVSQAHTLGAVVGSINAILMIASIGLAGPVLGAAPSAGAMILYGGTTAALSTAIPMTVSSIYAAYNPLQGELAQQIWMGGSYHTPGEIAGSSLLAFGIGAGLSSIGPVFNWFSNRTNAQLARALAVASAEGRPLTTLPNVQSTVISPGVVEISVTGQPGVIRVTRNGWQVVMRAGSGPQTVITEQAWGELHPEVAGRIENQFPALTGIRDTALVQPQGGIPLRFGVTQEGYFAMAPQARNPVTIGAWGNPAGGGTGEFPIILGAGGTGSRPVLQLPSGPSTPPRLYSGQVIIDLQGGDTRFTSGMVAGQPGARGYTVESGAWMLGYQNITRTVSPLTGGPVTAMDDLNLAMQIARNSPRWSLGTPVSQLGGELPPGLSLEQIDPAGQLFAQPPGVSLITEPFFPARGMGGRLIPISIGGQPAQMDVAGLETTIHPELWGQGTQVYMRRPFALQALSPAQADAMGQEVNRMTRPGGFFEFRLLRSGDRRIARTIAAQIPGAEVVEVDQRAIRTFVDSGYSSLPADTRQAEILRNAESDLRAGGLGGGNFNSIIRIYKPAGG